MEGKLCINTRKTPKCPLLSPAAGHESGGRRVRPSRLLARPRLAGGELAPLAGSAMTGEAEMAKRMRIASLEQVSTGGFSAYFEPFTGEPLGAQDQSWTAAVTLDWLSADYEADEASRRVA